jgi:hypothetical protein
MGRSTIFAHGADRIASLLKASPEGEGVHPSQNATLRNCSLDDLARREVDQPESEVFSALSETADDAGAVLRIIGSGTRIRVSRFGYPCIGEKNGPTRGKSRSVSLSASGTWERTSEAAHLGKRP